MAARLGEWCKTALAPRGEGWREAPGEGDMMVDQGISPLTLPLSLEGEGICERFAQASLEG